MEPTTKCGHSMSALFSDKMCWGITTAPKRNQMDPPQPLVPRMEL